MEATAPRQCTDLPTESRHHLRCLLPAVLGTKVATTATTATATGRSAKRCGRIWRIKWPNSTSRSITEKSKIERSLPKTSQQQQQSQQHSFTTATTTTYTYSCNKSHNYSFNYSTLLLLLLLFSLPCKTFYGKLIIPNFQLDPDCM